MAIYRTWKGYAIVFERRAHNFPLYVKHIRNGVVTWTTDYTYAGHYSEKTARKHNENIKAGKYTDKHGGGNDFIDFRKTAKVWKYSII